MRTWLIEGYFSDSKSLQRIRLQPLPFEVGRTSRAHLILDSTGISRNHARFFEKDGSLFLEDIGSTNGSYLNRERVYEPVEVRDGDIVHFADVECRMVTSGSAPVAEDSGRTRAITPLLSSALPQGTREFHELLEQQAVTAHFQPIVEPNGKRFGYEILGRGTHPDLPEAPMPLFRIAESLDLEVPFSELLRTVGLELAASFGPRAPYFFNLHPAEMGDIPRLVGALEAFRKRLPDLQAVLEIHETAVTQLGQMRDLRGELDELDIGLAYDDFGVGQARMLEVAEVPPDYVKFDMTLIRDIDRASDAHRSMVKMLVQFSRELDARTCAEGVSRPEEADACRDLEFDFLQGFYFGRPEPFDEE
jgi:EAL domain-containing protein (putative c-di-GMP-specific phosphodiesterase class I)